MNGNHRLTGGLLVALAGLSAAPGSAQSRVEFGPLVALYAPVGSFQPAPYYSTALPRTPGDLTGMAWGAQGRIWFSPRAGLQLLVASASSSVGGGISPGGGLPATSASVLTGSAQVLYLLGASSRGARLWGSAGPGLVRHQGAAYAPLGSPVQLAAAVGLGSAVPISRRVSAELGVTAFAYHLQVSDSLGTVVERGFQVDPLIHAGLSLRWP